MRQGAHRLLLLLLWFPAVAAAQSAVARAEVTYLLDAIDSSGCEFYRNGTWYDAHQAAAHLSNKYRVLTATGQIETAEDFIVKAASRSSFSGLPYETKCVGALSRSDVWLNAVLARHRTEITRYDKAHHT